MVSKGVKLALQMVGYIFTLGEAIAPSFITFRRIITQHSVGANTPFPYVLMWVNSVLHGSYEVRTLDKWEIGVYGVIFLITSIYCVIYVYHSNGVYRKLGWFMMAVQVVFAGLVITVDLTLYRDDVISKKRAQL